MKGKGWALLTALAVTAWGASASGKATFKPAIPNTAVNDCDTCHIPNDPNDARNLFGQELQPLADANAPLDTWWDAVKELDSDQDGQTNAQELGDPCLEWTMAMPAGRTFDISNPGDPMSVSPSPDVCEDPPMGEGGAGGGDGSGAGDGSGSGMGDGSGNGMGDGSGDGMGQGGAATDDGLSSRPADPQFTVAEPSGCASIAGERSSDAGWLVLGLIGLALSRRRR